MYGMVLEAVVMGNREGRVRYYERERDVMCVGKIVYACM